MSYWSCIFSQSLLNLLMFEKMGGHKCVRNFDGGGIDDVGGTRIHNPSFFGSPSCLACRLEIIVVTD